MSGIFVAGYGFAFADILRDAKSVVKAEIHPALSIYRSRFKFPFSSMECFGIPGWLPTGYFLPEDIF